MASIDWAKIEKILGSKAFENAAGVAGAGISAYAGSRQASAERNMNAQQLALQAALRRADANQAAATSAASATSLGDYEGFAFRQAILNAILPGLRNVSLTPGDPAVAAAMPKMTGGLRLPEGGLPAASLANLSPQATAAAIARRSGQVSNIDPNTPVPNFSSAGFSSEVSDAAQGVADGYRAAAMARKADEEAELQRYLAAALQQNYGSTKKKSGFASKLGTVIKVAVPLVLAATGVGAPAAAAWTAGANVAGSKLQGKSWKGAIVDGAIGAGTGALGGIGNAGRAATATSAASTAAQNWQRQNLARALRRSF